MRVLAEESWLWMLYEDRDRLVLSVLCSHGGAGYSEVTVELDPAETAAYRRDGTDHVQALARRIQQAPRQYRDRRLPHFHDENGVAEATARWRAESEQLRG